MHNVIGVTIALSFPVGTAVLSTAFGWHRCKIAPWKRAFWDA